MHPSQLVLAMLDQRLGAGQFPAPGWPPLRRHRTLPMPGRDHRGHRDHGRVPYQAAEATGRRGGLIPSADVGHAHAPDGPDVLYLASAAILAALSLASDLPAPSDSTH